MNPSITISIIFSIIGILPAIIVLLLFKSSKPKYHGLWFFGLLLIFSGAIVIGIGTELLINTEEWLTKQNSENMIEKGKEAIIYTRVWAYVFPAVTISLGVNLLTKFLLDNK